MFNFIRRFFKKSNRDREGLMFNKRLDAYDDKGIISDILSFTSLLKTKYMKDKELKALYYKLQEIEAELKSYYSGLNSFKNRPWWYSALVDFSKSVYIAFDAEFVFEKASLKDKVIKDRLAGKVFESSKIGIICYALASFDYLYDLASKGEIMKDPKKELPVEFRKVLYEILDIAGYSISEHVEDKILDRLMKNNIYNWEIYKDVLESINSNIEKFNSDIEKSNKQRPPKQKLPKMKLVNTTPESSADDEENYKGTPIQKAEQKRIEAEQKKIKAEQKKIKDQEEVKFYEAEVARWTAISADLKAKDDARKDEIDRKKNNSKKFKKSAEQLIAEQQPAEQQQLVNNNFAKLYKSIKS